MCTQAKSVLFVDDEHRVLDGLRRLLFPLSDLWRMEFACGGLEALEFLAKEPFDVIVTDLRMPGMDGAELLSHVARDYPHLVRVILSGTCQEDLRLMAAMTAHQYLSKPCDPDVLRNTLERAFALRNVLAGNSLREFVSRTASLPSTPAVYNELIKALRAEASAHQLGAIVTRDVAMTAKVLQMVNSAFFGLRTHITNPVEAVAYLGTEAIAALALSISAFSMFQTPPNCPFSIDDLQRHSTAVATLAQKLARSQNLSRAMVDDTFVAGLLHDVGKLVMVSRYPEKYAAFWELFGRGKVAEGVAEREIFGATHAEVGGYLLWLWGLPDTVVEAVTFHHEPELSPHNEFGSLTAVHIADALDRGGDGEKLSPEAPLNTEYLTRIGAIDRLPAWWELKKKIAEQE
jgi:putative nucleotidyltransferase with HDIG domain